MFPTLDVSFPLVKKVKKMALVIFSGKTKQKKFKIVSPLRKEVLDNYQLLEKNLKHLILVPEAHPKGKGRKTSYEKKTQQKNLESCQKKKKTLETPKHEAPTWPMDQPKRH